MNMLLLLASSTGNGRIVEALLFGVFLGAVLVWSGFADPDRVRDALMLRDKELILSFLWMMLLAVLFCRIGYAMEFIPRTVMAESRLSSALLGGIFCGIGLFLARLTPLGALAAVAGGRLHVLGAVIGMLGAVIVHARFGNGLDRISGSWDIPLGQAASRMEFFNASNPALWAAVFLAALFLIVLIALRRS